MLNKAFRDISVDDLQGLIAAGATEGSNLEFKREVWGSGDEEVREMLRDISSLANAYGGTLIVGMDEESATGKALTLVPVPNAGDERDRIFASCMANLQPRIIGLEIKTIEIAVGQEVLLIKVPAGVELHQITFKGLYQFWIRHDRQKNRMSYDEIKDAILRNNLSTKGTEALLAERKRSLEGRNRIFVVSAAPLKLEAELFKIDNQRIRELLKDTPVRQHGWHLNISGHQVRPSLNGISIGDEARKIELYRNGYMEAVLTMQEDYFYEEKEISRLGRGQTSVFRNAAIVETTYNFFTKLEAIMHEIGYDAPLIAQIQMFGINAMVLPEGHHSNFSPDYAVAPQNSIEISMTYETLNAKIITKELCDRLWQAFHFEHEPYFIGGDFQFEHA